MSEELIKAFTALRSEVQKAAPEAEFDLTISNLPLKVIGEFMVEGKDDEDANYSQHQRTPSLGKFTGDIFSCRVEKGLTLESVLFNLKDRK